MIFFRSAVAAAMACAAAGAVEAAQLPNGVSSLSETYGDWVVACQMQNDTPRCQMTQTQTDTKSRQLVMAMEVRAGADGAMNATLLMPFGLALAKGVSVQVDEGRDTLTADFATCLPSGCLAPLAFKAPLTDLLRTGKTLNVAAVAADDGKPFAVKVSLNGFSTAWERLVALGQ